MTRYPLRNLRLRPGEEHREDVLVALEPLALGGQEYVVLPSQVPVALVVQRASSGDVFRVAFALEVAGPCMRCLADAAVALELDAREYQDAAPDAAPELRSEYVAEGYLLLGDWVRDQVALALPDPVLCRPDCAGLCGVCGRDLNVDPHEHADDAVDPRWAALEALREHGP